jgi:hypothetical protein
LGDRLIPAGQVHASILTSAVATARVALRTFGERDA